MSQKTKSRKDEDGDGSAKHSQVRMRLIEQMHTGVLPADGPLPGQRKLADSLGVAVGTLRRALLGLESDGFVRRVPSKGVFVNSPLEQRKQVGISAFSIILPSVSAIPYPSLIESVHHLADEIGYETIIGGTDNEPVKQEKLLRRAVEQKVAGVVMVPTTIAASAEQVRLIQSSGIPLVFCHRAIPEINAPLVTWSFSDVGRLSAEVLIKHGHRRILGLPTIRHPYTVMVADAVRSTLDAHGIDSSNYQVFYHGGVETGDVLRQAVRESLEQAFRYKEYCPTAIHCLTFDAAEAVYLMASDLGFRIPEDISLIYFGGTRPGSELARRITCVARDEYDIGRQAGKLLGEMCSNETGVSSQDGQSIEVPLTLLPGETVGPAPTSHR